MMQTDSSRGPQERAERRDGEERPELADDFPPELPGFPANKWVHMRWV